MLTTRFNFFVIILTIFDNFCKSFEALCHCSASWVVRDLQFYKNWWLVLLSDSGNLEQDNACACLHFVSFFFFWSMHFFALSYHSQSFVSLASNLFQICFVSTNMFQWGSGTSCARLDCFTVCLPSLTGANDQMTAGGEWGSPATRSPGEIPATWQLHAGWHATPGSLWRHWPSPEMWGILLVVHLAVMGFVLLRCSFLSHGVMLIGEICQVEVRKIALFWCAVCKSRGENHAVGGAIALRIVWLIDAMPPSWHFHKEERAELQVAAAPHFAKQK